MTGRETDVQVVISSNHHQPTDGRTDRQTDRLRVRGFHNATPSGRRMDCKKKINQGDAVTTDRRTDRPTNRCACVVSTMLPHQDEGWTTKRKKSRQGGRSLARSAQVLFLPTTTKTADCSARWLYRHILDTGQKTQNSVDNTPHTPRGANREAKVRNNKTQKGFSCRMMPRRQRFNHWQ